MWPITFIGGGNMENAYDTVLNGKEIKLSYTMIAAINLGKEGKK